MKPGRTRATSQIKKRKPTDRTILGRGLAREWKKMLKGKPELQKNVNDTVRTTLRTLSDKKVSEAVKKAKQLGREN